MIVLREGVGWWVGRAAAVTPVANRQPIAVVMLKDCLELASYFSYNIVTTHTQAHTMTEGSCSIERYVVCDINPLATGRAAQCRM